MCLFFFKLIANNRDLHSFPTRRSSDLDARKALRARTTIGTDLVSVLRGLFRFEADFLEHLRLRSEEHTSELQSLRHLVCRLLLVKKKKKKNQPCGSE